MKPRPLALCLCLLYVTLMTARPTSAAPVFGKIFDLRQTDGSTVPTRMWGDEVVESLDGVTLVRDHVLPLWPVPRLRKTACRTCVGLLPSVARRHLGKPT